MTDEVVNESAPEAVAAETVAEITTEGGEAVDTSQTIERPDWLLDKFQGDDAIEKQAKSYAELQKKMGEHWGTPKDGYALSEELGLEMDDPIIKGMAPHLEEMGLSNKGFEKLAKAYLESMDGVLEQRAQELGKLRETMGVEIDRAETYIRNSLPENEAKALLDSINDPVAFAAIDRIIARSGPVNNAPSRDAQYGGPEPLAAILSEKSENWKKYSTDRRYRDEITKRERRARAAEARRS